MGRFRPISRTITVAILVPLGILLFITLMFERWSVTNQVRQNVDLEISKQMNELQVLANTGIDPSTSEAFSTSEALLETFLLRRISAENETMFGTVDSTVFFRSLGNSNLRADQISEFLDVVLSLDSPTIDTFHTELGELRYGVYPISGLDGKTGRLTIVVNLDSELAATNTLFRNLTIGLIMLFAITALVLSYIIKRTLNPIAELTTAAQNVSKDNFPHSIEVVSRRANDEISLLHNEFNSMLKRLEESFHEQQRFIDDAGHELRTPLTIVKGHIELLQREGVNSQTLSIIEDEVDRMGRLVQDLQSLTKASQPNFIQMQTFACDVFIKEVFEKAQSIYSNPLELEEYDSSRMLGDKQRLTQAMLQLVENAAKYSDTESPISIGLRRDKANVVLYVKDNGSGIPDASKQKVFSRFFQVDNTHSSNDVGGVGLGLSIVKAIVEGHRGRIVILDNIPQGTIFELVLPQRVNE